MLHLTNNGEYGIDLFPKSNFIIWIYFIRLQTEIIHLKMVDTFVNLVICVIFQLKSTVLFAKEYSVYPIYYSLHIGRLLG
jgi:hypothetical protein